MNKYLVKVTEKHSAEIWVEAETQREAEKKAIDEVETEFELLYDVETLTTLEEDSEGTSIYWGENVMGEVKSFVGYVTSDGKAFDEKFEADYWQAVLNFNEHYKTTRPDLYGTSCLDSLSKFRVHQDVLVRYLMNNEEAVLEFLNAVKKSREEREAKDAEENG